MIIDEIDDLAMGRRQPLEALKQHRAALGLLHRLLRIVGRIPEARIRSVLRRSAPTAAAAPQGTRQNAPIRFGTKWLDLDAQVLRDHDGNECPRASSEFALLKVFAENPKG